MSDVLCISVISNSLREVLSQFFLFLWPPMFEPIHAPLTSAKVGTGYHRGKSQCQTFQAGTKNAISWDSQLQRGLSYVMLSRSKRLKDINIREGVFDIQQIPCSSPVNLIFETVYNEPGKYTFIQSIQSSTAICFHSVAKIYNPLKPKILDNSNDILQSNCEILLLAGTCLEEHYLLGGHFINAHHVKEGMDRAVSAFGSEFLASFLPYSSLKEKVFERRVFPSIRFIGIINTKCLCLGT